MSNVRIMTKAAKGEKTEKLCPVSRDEYYRNAPVVPVTINGETFELKPVEFSTKTLGFMLCGQRFKFRCGSVELEASIDLKCYVPKSKELPPAVLDENQAEAPAAETIG